MILFIFSFLVVVNGNRNHLGHKYEVNAKILNYHNHLHRRSLERSNLQNPVDEYDEYNEIQDLSRENLKQRKEKIDLNLIVNVPVSKIVTMKVVNQEESPLNVSFLPVLEEVKLKENLTVTFKEENIVKAVVKKVQDILADSGSDSTVDSIIDTLKKENVTLVATKVEKDPIDVYLELLDSIILPETDEENDNLTKVNEEVVDFLKELQQSEENYDDDSNDSVDHFQNLEMESDETKEFEQITESIPENFSEDDLLLGDSFENEGNIDFVNTKEPDRFLEQTEEQEDDDEEDFARQATIAFPELYKDLTVFKKPLKKKNRRIDIEKKIIKRAETLHSDAIKSDSMKEVKIETTTSTISKQDELEPTTSPHLFIGDVDDTSFEEDLVIKSSSGRVYGAKKESSSGNMIYEFLGIPYASPPVGKLRFKSPQPAEAWEGVMNTTSITPPR